MNKNILFVLVLLMFSVMVSVAMAEDANTPEETEEEILCVAEGESIPVIAEPPECCEGLALILPAEEDILGISGWCTALCGDGECGENESNYNCPTDCEVEKETEVEVDDGINPETGEEIVSAETASEIAAFDLGPGAQVRMLQLEKAIFKGTLFGEKAIEYIEETYPEGDTSVLVGILAELEVLKDEVAAFEPGEDKGEAVKAFVDFKNDARSLTKQFRDAVKEVLSGEDRAALAEKFKEIDKTELDALNEQIKELVREFNAQRVERFTEFVGETGPELAQKVRNGELNMNQIKARIGEAFKGLKPVNKQQAFNKMKEANAKVRVAQQAKTVAAKNQFLERRVNRLENRVEKIGDKLEQTKERFRAVVENVKGQVRDRIQQRINEPKKPLGGIRPTLVSNAQGAGE